MKTIYEASLALLEESAHELGRSIDTHESNERDGTLWYNRPKEELSPSEREDYTRKMMSAGYHFLLGCTEQAARLPWPVPGNPHELIVPYPSENELQVDYALLTTTGTGNYQLIIPSKEMHEKQQAMHPLQEIHVENAKIIDTLHPIGEDEIQRALSYKANLIRSTGIPLEERHSELDARIFPTFKECFELAKTKAISLQEIHDVIHDEKILKDPTLTKRDRKDIDHQYREAHPPTACGFLNINPRAFLKTKNHEIQQVVETVLAAWRENLHEDIQKTLQPYGAYDELTRKIEPFQVPFAWMKQISQNTRLTQWFLRYPATLIVLTHKSNSYREVRESLKERSLSARNQHLRAYAARRFLVPWIFQMISEGKPDDEILRRLDPPIVKPNFEPYAHGDYPGGQGTHRSPVPGQGMIARALSPSERKNRASRNGAWLNRAGNLYQAFANQEVENNIQGRINHRTGTDFGPGVLHVDKHFLQESYDSRRTCSHPETGRLLSPEEFILAVLTSPGLPLDPHALYDRRTYDHLYRSPMLLEFTHHDSMGTHFYRITDPENLQQALIEQTKRNHPELLNPPQTQEIAHKALQLGKILDGESYDLLEALTRNEIHDPNYLSEHVGSIQTHMSARLLVRATHEWAHNDLGTEITEAEHNAQQAKILEMEQARNPQLRTKTTETTKRAREPEWVSAELQEHAPPGWTIQPLNTLTALRREGRELRHCVGSYGPSIIHAEKPSHIYQVTTENRERLTLQIRYDLEEQSFHYRNCHGKNNRPPSPEAFRSIETILEKLNQLAPNQDQEQESRKQARTYIESMTSVREIPPEARQAGVQAAQEVFFRRIPKLKKLMGIRTKPEQKQEQDLPLGYPEQDHPNLRPNLP